ncbi:hypothetical protein DPMN_127683 [Dreissena polymorpha]|uniref:Uncharacterized protein n=1 Tax=Dreissena polymorpha TaxID=45954 RepID=A0A9D4JVP1_DREPO|nr:hypothetical protein DPMN_127683 [Dreissena polymorpha]
MGPSGCPLAPSVYSDTFGTCCFNTKGLVFLYFLGLTRRGPGPHEETYPQNSTVTMAAMWKSRIRF